MISFFLSMIGAIFAYYGWQGFRERRVQIAESVSAVGLIVEIVPNSVNGRQLYSPKVAFTTPHGQNVVFVSDYGSSSKTFQANQPIEVFYNPQNPQQAGIKADTSANLLYPLLMITGELVAIGGLFFAIIEALFYYLIRRVRAKLTFKI